MIIFNPIGCLLRNNALWRGSNTRILNQIEPMKRRARELPRKHPVKISSQDADLLPGGLANARRGRLLGPTIFSLGFAGSCLVLSAIWECENLKSEAVDQQQTSPAASATVHNHPEDCQSCGIQNSRPAHCWKNKKDDGKLFHPILLANGTVFLAWKFPGLRRFMVKYFTAKPFARSVCWPMVFSCFSHKWIVHFIINMCALSVFIPLATARMGKEQLLGFYLSACSLSALVHHFYFVLAKRPSISLGASGAALAVLGYLGAYSFETEVLNGPFELKPESSFIWLLLLMVIRTDVSGLLKGYSNTLPIGHAAHLGGTFFGIFWYLWGQKNVWGQRVPLMQRLHEFRTRADA